MYMFWLCNHTSSQQPMRAHTFETRSRCLNFFLFCSSSPRCTPLLIIPSNCITKPAPPQCAHMPPMLRRTQFVSPKAQYDYSTRRAVRSLAPLDSVIANPIYVYMNASIKKTTNRLTRVCQMLVGTAARI